ncbi:MAG: gliding motility-associated C-terminal domain-containing protein, partial [Bacteroidales bacterium]
ITDANLCVKVDSVEVPYDGIGCITVNDIPTVITPNGDGFNDEWTIPFIELYPKASVEIFTRWGKLVFSSRNGYVVKWDGTQNGNELPMDSYYFIIDLGNGTEPIVGNVTIIR